MDLINTTVNTLDSFGITFRFLAILAEYLVYALNLSAQRKTTQRPKFDLEGGGFFPRRAFLGGCYGKALIIKKQKRGLLEPRISKTGDTAEVIEKDAHILKGIEKAVGYVDHYAPPEKKKGKK